MVVEVIGALSLPVWLVVEEVLRQRALSAERGPAAVAQPARRPQQPPEVALSHSA
jgi:hypothetical protein